MDGIFIILKDCCHIIILADVDDDDDENLGWQWVHVVKRKRHFRIVCLVSI